MKKEEITIECDPKVRKDPFRVVAFCLDPSGEDRKLVDEALEIAKALKATKSAPSGKSRNPEHLFKTRYLGVMSEILIEKFLKEQLGDSVQVKRNEEYTTHEEHVDISITEQSVSIAIEVRGSFPYKPLQKVICELFDVIGPYTTKYKPRETIKDFYLRTLINSHINQFDPNSPHKIYFVGGAEYDLLREIGYKTNFKQKGANYWAIKPIAKARDVEQIVRLIKDRLYKVM